MAEKYTEMKKQFLLVVVVICAICTSSWGQVNMRKSAEKTAKKDEKREWKENRKLQKADKKKDKKLERKLNKEAKQGKEIFPER